MEEEISNRFCEDKNYIINLCEFLSKEKEPLLYEKVNSNLNSLKFNQLFFDTFKKKEKLPLINDKKVLISFLDFFYNKIQNFDIQKRPIEEIIIIPKIYKDFSKNIFNLFLNNNFDFKDIEKYLYDFNFFRCFFETLKNYYSNVKNFDLIFKSLFKNLLEKVFNENFLLFVEFKKIFINDLISQFKFIKNNDSDFIEKNDLIYCDGLIENIKSVLECIENKNETMYKEFKEYVFKCFIVFDVDLFGQKKYFEEIDKEDEDENANDEDESKIIKKIKKRQKEIENENNNDENNNEKINKNDKKKDEKKINEKIKNEKNEIKNKKKEKKEENEKNEIKNRKKEKKEEKKEEKEEKEKNEIKNKKKEKKEEKKEKKEEKKEKKEIENKNDNKKEKKLIKKKEPEIEKKRNKIEIKNPKQVLSTKKEESTENKKSLRSSSKEKKLLQNKRKRSLSNSSSNSKIKTRNQKNQEKKEKKEKKLKKIKKINLKSTPEKLLKKLPKKSIMKKTSSENSLNSSKLSNQKSTKSNSAEKNNNFYHDLNEKFSKEKFKSPSKFNLTPMKTKKENGIIKKERERSRSKSNEKKKFEKKNLFDDNKKNKNISFNNDRFVKEFDPKTPVRDVKKRGIRKSPLEKSKK